VSWQTLGDFVGPEVGTGRVKVAGFPRDFLVVNEVGSLLFPEGKVADPASLLLALKEPQVDAVSRHTM